MEEFSKFKKELDEGSSQFLFCENGKEDEAKIRLMKKIFGYLSPLNVDDISWIMNDVRVQSGLKSRLRSLARNNKFRQEVSKLLNFIKNSYFSACSQFDEGVRDKEFRLVESKRTFEEILHSSGDVRELYQFTGIQVAMLLLDEVAVYYQRGIFDEYNKFLKRHLKDRDFTNAIEMFNL